MCLPMCRKPQDKVGRPKQYGRKVKLRSLFDFPERMSEEKSPVYGENNALLRYRSVDLLLKRIGILVRFVALIPGTMHPLVHGPLLVPA